MLSLLLQSSSRPFYRCQTPVFMAYSVNVIRFQTGSSSVKIFIDCPIFSSIVLSCAVFLINFAVIFRVIQKLKVNRGKKNNPCFKSLSLGGMHAMLRALACSPMPRACSAHVSCCGGGDEGRADLQKNMADNLAVSDFCINTHTHTHTHIRAALLLLSHKKNRARNIQTFFQAGKGNRSISFVGCFCIPAADALLPLLPVAALLHNGKQQFTHALLLPFHARPSQRVHSLLLSGKKRYS